MLMALWRKFKLLFRRQKHELLSYNHEHLQTRMEAVYTDLYHVRGSDGITMAIRLIETARNIKLLEMARLRPDAISVAQAQGQLLAFNDLLAAIDWASDPEVYKTQSKVAKPKVVKTLLRETQRSNAVI